MKRERNTPRPIASIIVFVFAVLFTAASVVLLYSIYDAGNFDPSESGEAIGFVFALILMLAPTILFGVFGLVFDLVCLGLSISLVRYGAGGSRTWGIVCTVLSSLMALTLIGSFLFVFIAIGLEPGA